MYSHLLLKLNQGQLSRHDFDVNNSLTDYIVNHMKHKINNTYIIDHYVVKQLTPCQQDYCQDLDKPFIKNNHHYILPNLFSSITINVLLNHLHIHFIDIIASMLLYNKHVLSLYKLQNKLNKYPLTIINNINLQLMLFQLSHALMTAQQVYQFTHYDLSYHNIILTDYPSHIKYINYPLPNIKQRLIINQNYCPFIVKIKHFELARIETKQFSVTPLLTTYKDFLPWYDLATFLGSIIIDQQLRKSFHDLFKNKQIYQFVLELILYLFNDIIDITNYNKKELNEIRDYIGYRYYEEENNKLTYKPKIDNHGQSMVNVVNHLGQLLLQTNYITKHVNQHVLIIDDLSPYHIYDFNAETDLTLSVCADENLKLTGYLKCKNKSTLKTVKINQKLKNFGPGCQLTKTLSKTLLKFMQNCTQYFCSLIPFDQYIVWRYTIGSATINNNLIFNQIGQNAKYWCYLLFLYFYNTYNTLAGVPFAFQKYKHYFENPNLFNINTNINEIKDIIYLYTNRLQDIILKAPKPTKDIIVYKVSGRYPQLPDPEHFTPTSVLQLPFNSTTINPHFNFATFISQDVLNSSDIGCCFYYITIPQNQSCLYVPKEFHAYPYENEIILPYNITFDITDVTIDLFHFIDVNTVNIVNVQDDKKSIVMGPVYELDTYNPCHGVCKIQEKEFYNYHTIVKNDYHNNL